MALRVIHAIESFAPQAGSIPLCLAPLLNALRSQDVESHVVTLTGGVDPSYATEVTVLGASGGNGLALYPQDLLRNANILHLHGLYNKLNRDFAPAARRAGLPTVISPLGMLSPRPFQEHPWRRRWAAFRYENSNLREATRIHAVSTVEAETLRLRGLAERAVILQVGLDPEPETGSTVPSPESTGLSLPAGRRLLLLLGPIHPYEGLIPLLRVCEDLVHDLEQWHLVMAGPIPPQWQRSIEAAARRKGTADRVTLIADPTPEQQRALLHRVDLLVQPALIDRPPVAALQAMAAGRPVILSDSCGMREVETAGAGRVVPPGRATLRTALRDLANRPLEDLARIGAAGRELLRREFSCAVLAPRYAELYRSLVRPA